MPAGYESHVCPHRDARVSIARNWFGYTRPQHRTCEVRRVTIEETRDTRFRCLKAMEQTRPSVFCCPEFVSPSADFFPLVGSHILGVANPMSMIFPVFFCHHHQEDDPDQRFGSQKYNKRVAHFIHFPPLGFPPANLLFHFREANSGWSDQDVQGLT